MGRGGVGIRHNHDGFGGVYGTSKSGPFDDDEITISDPVSPCPISYNSRKAAAKILIELEQLDVSRCVGCGEGWGGRRHNHDGFGSVYGTSKSGPFDDDEMA